MAFLLVLSSLACANAPVKRGKRTCARARLCVQAHGEFNPDNKY